MLYRDFWRNVGCASTFGLAVVALGSPAMANHPQPATADEKQAVNVAFVECQKSQARKFDDGVSDAMTIARAVATACSQERRNVADTLAKGDKNPMVRPMMERQFDEQAVAWAIQAVLYVRRHPAAPPPDHPQ